MYYLTKKLKKQNLKASVKNKKVFLFVDGTNLYAGQFALFGPDNYLRFNSLIKVVEEKLEVEFNKIYFYASYSPKSKNPTKKAKQYLKNEALFYKSVKNTKNVEFFGGYRSPTSGKEKEVDVKLTADIVTMAFLNKYDDVYLFTGDADFLQALFCIKKYHEKKNIFLLCLENKILYKGAFYYNTHILKFNSIGINFHRKQKVNFLEFDLKSVVEVIK